MDEMEYTGTEMNGTADQQDAFLDGWDGSESVAEADQPGTEADEETAGTEENTEDAEAGDDAAQESEADTQAAQEGAEDVRQGAEDGGTPETAWIIKHNGTELTVKPGDITPELLQKGVDYDRIRTKYDEAKPVMEVFSGLAKANGMTVEEYVRVVRAAVKKADGMSEAEANRAIELEDREAAVAAREAEQQENEAAVSQQSERIGADLREFAAAFPDAYKQAETNPETIPQSVWEAVRSGLSLTAAYARYAVESANRAARAAQDQANAAALNRKNSARSAGSMQSAGNENRQKDPFLDGWGS